MSIFRAEQFVPHPLAEVFDFFSRAENLQELTPPWLNFRILDVSTNPVRQGTLIRYALRWRIFPIRWTTEILEFDPPQRFVDVQLKGPYKKWHHEHRFVAENGGTRIFDEVQYELPFGALGAIANRFQVRRDVEAIFEFRREAIKRRFGSTRHA